MANINCLIISLNDLLFTEFLLNRSQYSTGVSSIVWGFLEKVPGAMQESLDFSVDSPEDVEEIVDVDP